MPVLAFVFVILSPAIGLLATLQLVIVLLGLGVLVRRPPEAIERVVTGLALYPVRRWVADPVARWFRAGEIVEDE